MITEQMINKATEIAKNYIRNIYGIPSEIKNEILSWDVVLKSVNTDSFYNTWEKEWEYTPDKTLRVSDHWNFKTNNNSITIHCKTDKPVSNNEEWAIGEYDLEKNIYKILKIFKNEGYEIDEFLLKQYNIETNFIQVKKSALSLIRKRKKEADKYFSKLDKFDKVKISEAKCDDILHTLHYIEKNAIDRFLTIKSQKRVGKENILLFECLYENHLINVPENRILNIYRETENI